MKDLPIKIVTLSFVQEETRMLLGLKKRGFGAGRWNGFGGKIEPGETPEVAAKRELLEESGVRALGMDACGNIEFAFDESRPFIMYVHLFRVKKYSGKITETEEMKPRWFEFQEIPYDSMWLDDKYWLPEFIKGKNIKAKFKLDSKDEIVEKEIKFYT